MNTKHILIAALLAGLFAGARAESGETPAAFHVETIENAGMEDTGGAGEEVVQRFEMRGGGADAHGDHSRFTGPLMGAHGRAVKNAPYSAEMISEQQHNLADGNQIANKRSTMSYRDSAGRTRTEVRDASGTIRTITINDPAEGITYILRPESKTATRIGPRREMARIAGEKARLKIEALRKEGGNPDREQIIVKRIERAEGDAARRIGENVRIHVAREMGHARAMGGLHRLEHLSPMLAGAFGDLKYSSRATTKDLGTKEIEGVKANGKLRSYEIPAGEIGNRNAIVVSNETWYSPDLHVTLLSKRSDPRTGERTLRVSGLKRDEPAAALFTVPSDYTVRDAMASMKKMEEKK